jgi:hypothetical protein
MPNSLLKLTDGTKSATIFIRSPLPAHRKTFCNISTDCSNEDSDAEIVFRDDCNRLHCCYASFPTGRLLSSVIRRDGTREWHCRGLLHRIEVDEFNNFLPAIIGEKVRRWFYKGVEYSFEEFERKFFVLKTYSSIASQ